MTPRTCSVALLLLASCAPKESPKPAAEAAAPAMPTQVSTTEGFSTPESVIWDGDQQVWFVRRFGPEVNLSNVPAGEVLALETLRLGLRSDTLGIGGR